MPKLTKLVLSGVGLLCAFGLVACAPLESQAVHSDALPASSAADAAVVTLNGVIGSGQFTSTELQISGTVTVTAVDGEFDLALSDFHSSEAGELDLRFSPWPATTKCLADQYSFSFGNISNAPSQTGLRLGSADLHYGDPTFYNTVVIARIAGHQSASIDPNGCVLTPIAVAPITWNVPDTRPNLKLVDSGSGAGAQGTVTMTAGGPTSYLVAPDDNLIGIARRFGITVDDLGFLNPLMTRGLLADETLNLSKERRGAGSVQPPPSP